MASIGLGDAGTGPSYVNDGRRDFAEKVMAATGGDLVGGAATKEGRLLVVADAVAASACTGDFAPFDGTRASAEFFRRKGPGIFVTAAVTAFWSEASSELLRCCRELLPVRPKPGVPAAATGTGDDTVGVVGVEDPEAPIARFDENPITVLDRRSLFPVVGTATK